MPTSWTELPLMSDREPEAIVPSARRINGWLVLFGFEFARSYEKLRAEVRTLKNALPPDAYRQHPTVKLFAHLRRFVREIVPSNPNAPDFMLEGDLARFRRGKGYGLPERYRIMWAFSSQRKVIIFLYLNDETTLRKAGASTDPYEVFRRLLQQGRIGANFEANYRTWLDANPGQRDEITAEVGPPATGSEPSARRAGGHQRSTRPRHRQ
jgi:toxin YhaV